MRAKCNNVRFFACCCSRRDSIHQRTGGCETGQSRRRRELRVRAVEGRTEGGVVQGQQKDSPGHGARHPGGRKNAPTCRQESHPEGHGNISSGFHAPQHVG